jgi:xanthine/CO dehydrogenase XdhC/CoxF family maturation factor
MMHGREKSDPAIVAMKPANNAVLAAAELVERRAGAKGLGREERTNRDSKARAGRRPGPA